MMDLTKRLLVLFILLVACKGNEPVDPTNDLEGYFEQVWSDFDETYSYFELKGIDWDSVYTVNRPKVVNGQTTSNELADIIGEMVVSLKDLHLYFKAGNNVYRFQNRDQFASNSPTNAPNYLSSTTFNTNTVQYGDIQNSNIAYLQIKTLNKNSDFSPLETVLSELPGKDGLILDLRDNGGGSDGIARNFVNRLTLEEKTHEFYRFRNGPGRNDFGSWKEAKIKPDNPIDFDKPIVVLTNRGVVSSTESFVTMMRVLPNTTFIGDTTRGSTGNPKLFTLSNGWEYNISRWQAVTPEFEYIEDRGIAPDIAINNTDETMSEGRDLILEKAIELMQ